ncbi:sugar transferase [Vallicoccus soli]|uniref:Sugar transferase n=1 Tax=Vallicoccus soli TaxID=2339232 RepID=A0A3A3ZNJ8_9ACTN|nr:sugar transferase [Vallicoccus soli]
MLVDSGAGLLAGVAALVGRFGDGPHPAPAAYAAAAALAPMVWVLSLAAHRAYEPRFLGSGPDELRRVAASALHLGALVAVLAYVTKTDVARGFLAIALPAALVLDLAGRSLLRRRLHREWAAGRSVQRVLALGRTEDVLHLADQLSREPSHGLQVVGAVVTDDDHQGAVARRFSTVLPGPDRVEDAVAATAADTVAVVSSPELAGEDLRRLAWRLEAAGTELVVSPGIVEVAGPRLSIRPAAGLSLLHVEHPVLSGSRLLLKSLIDRALAALALVVLSPLLLVLGTLVATTSEGPAIYRQRRVGAHGREFTMLKFRSMYVDADARRAELLAQSDGDGVLFKMRRDPRVTRVGQVLRRYSLDELPQLVNVLLGHMALVGPRPPLPVEVAAYPEEAHRRLLVRPGLTGLWQVSGRSDLSWEESLRLDLRYVDNWSLSLDAHVLWRTGRAVLAGRGAY